MAEEKDKEKEKDMTKEYEAIKKKYSLPELNELDKEFYIGKLEDTPFILRSIIMKMLERLEYIIKMLNSVIQPENSFTDMYEAESLSDDEKKNAFELLKKTAYYHRELLMRDFDYSDDTAAALILKVFKDWKEIKKDFLRILDKMKESWKSQTKSKIEENYFG
jgi:hypothetical protein